MYCCSCQLYCCLCLHKCTVNKIFVKHFQLKDSIIRSQCSDVGQKCVDFLQARPISFNWVIPRDRRGLFKTFAFLRNLSQKSWVFKAKISFANGYFHKQDCKNFCEHFFGITKYICFLIISHPKLFVFTSNTKKYGYVDLQNFTLKFEIAKLKKTAYESKEIANILKFTNL